MAGRGIANQGNHRGCRSRLHSLVVSDVLWLSLPYLKSLAVGVGSTVPARGRTSTSVPASPVRSGGIIHTRILRTSSRSGHDADLRRSTSHRPAQSTDHRHFGEPGLHWSPSLKSAE